MVNSYIFCMFATNYYKIVLNTRLLSVLNETLGAGKPTTKDNYIFHCPVCNHHKPKLEIGINSNKWHCWVCSKGGKKLNSLLSFISATRETYTKFHEFIHVFKPNILNKYKDRGNGVTTIQEVDIPITLPNEYIPLSIVDNNNWFWRSAINYLLINRKLRYIDIIKYKLGYCLDGRYKNMIIFPSYNSSGTLNYFMGRTFITTNNSMEFKLPQVSKDIVGFELYVDWSEPVIIVESALNAITVRRNVTPLYGKTISKALRKKILSSRTPEVIIALDPDAIIQAIEAVEIFIGNGLRVKLVQLEGDCDINDIGYESIWDKINNSRYLTSRDLFKIKTSTLLSLK